MFKQPQDLEPFYDEIIRTAIFTVKPDNIATFLGQRITYNCKKEVGTNYNQRIPGTRIKHHMGDVSIKMYDKFGHVLRTESTCNDIRTFRVKRKVEHRDGSSTEQKASQLLTNSEKSISDIILELGFTDRTHFYKLFEKEFGMPSRAYRLHNTREHSL